MRIYKYIPHRYVDAFVEKGEILFRSLSYFRCYEEQQVVGDRHEAKRMFSPPAGLEITVTGTGEKFTVPRSFESAAKADEIFVFCTSMVLSATLAQEFNADACVEIYDIPKFASKLKSALPVTGQRPYEMIHGAISYYNSSDPPIGVWAFPDIIIMQKLDAYSRQREYRFAFAPKELLQFGSTTQQLVEGSSVEQNTPINQNQQILTVGCIDDICKVHTWPSV